MLDLQRQRSGYQFKESVFFARGFLITHLVIGAAVAAALMFHELFAFALTVAGWYLISLLLMAGMAMRRQACRICLALWFVLGAGGVIAYLVWFLPVTDAAAGDENTVRLSLRIMPLWLSSVALGYAVGGVMLFVSRRMERATMRGFALWEAPRV